MFLFFEKPNPKVNIIAKERKKKSDYKDRYYNDFL